MKPKRSIFRNTLIAGVFMIAAVVTTSCDSGALNPRLAKKALEKEAMFADSSCVRSFTTGFYEVNPTQLNQLRQLKQAGMIDLTETPVIEKKKVSNYSYWTGYTTATQDVEHIFATVALTENAKKYIVSHVVRHRDDQETDLKLRNGAIEESTPDYILSNNDLNTGEDIEEIVAETAEAEEEMLAPTDTVESATPKNETHTSAPTASSGYDAMAAKTEKQSHDMLLGRFELVKVKEVFCPENMQKNGAGSCSYIYRFVDKTPFGHVFDAPKSNILMTGAATFRHYVDMGWTVEHNNPQ